MAYYAYNPPNNLGAALNLLNDLFPIGWQAKQQQEAAKQQTNWLNEYRGMERERFENEKAGWKLKQLEQQRQKALRGVGQPVEIEEEVPPVELSPIAGALPPDFGSQPTDFISTEDEPQMITPGQRYRPPQAAPMVQAINPPVPTPKIFEGITPTELPGMKVHDEPAVVAPSSVPAIEPVPSVPVRAQRAETKVATPPAAPKTQKRQVSGMWHELDDAARARILSRTQKDVPDISELEVAKEWNAYQAARAKEFTPQTVKGLPVTSASGKIGEAPQVTHEVPKATEKQPTEAQSNAKLYGNRMAFNNRIVARIEEQGFDPATRIWSPELLKGGTRRSWERAAENWISAALRKESGATISDAERQAAMQEYFPTFGDSPEVIEEKRNRRQLAEDVMFDIAGPGEKRVDLDKYDKGTKTNQEKQKGSSAKNPILIKSRADRAKLAPGTWVTDGEHVGQIK